MNLATIKLYVALAWFSCRNHLGGWRYIVSRLGSYIFFTLVIGEFWRALIAQGTRNFGFDGNDIVWYSGVGQLIVFASTRIFARIEDDVLSGNIAYSLTRPIDYIELRLAEGIGGLVANLLLFLPVGFIVCYLDTGTMPKGSIPYTVLFIVFASLLHMLFQVLAGFSGVWLHDVQLPYRIYQKIMLVLGGLEVPVSVYPPWAQLVSWATPLGLMLARPCNAIFNPDPSALFVSAILLFGWVVAMFALVLSSYKYVHKHISVNGG
jgi:ABC-2 type transport system permease protein